MKIILAAALALTLAACDEPRNRNEQTLRDIASNQQEQLREMRHEESRREVEADLCTFFSQGCK